MCVGWSAGSLSTEGNMRSVHTDMPIPRSTRWPASPLVSGATTIPVPTCVPSFLLKSQQSRPCPSHDLLLPPPSLLPSPFRTPSPHHPILTLEPAPKPHCSISLVDPIFFFFYGIHYSTDTHCSYGERSREELVLKGEFKEVNREEKKRREKRKREERR